MNPSLTPSQTRLWADTALAVIDLETTQDPTGGFRIVDIAMVTCRQATQVDHWTTWVNPETPIDPDSETIHGLGDQNVALAPTFKDIAATVTQKLQPDPGETLVVVAHNAGFDLPILRSELRRAGHKLPALPVLDTARDFPNLAGLHPDSRSLQHLCEALGIQHSKQHRATDDARDTASAAIELLHRCLEQGYLSVDRIVQHVGIDTGHYTRQPAHFTSIRRSSRPISEEHHQRHTELQNGAQPPDDTTWITYFIECAELRCSQTTSTVRLGLAAGVNTETITTALAFLADQKDTAGSATLIGGALDPVFDQVSDKSTVVRRREIVELGAFWQENLQTLGEFRCAPKDQCPKCFDDSPCSLDIWVDALAAEGVGHTKGNLDSFYSRDDYRREHRRGGFYRWKLAGHVAMADAGLAHVVASAVAAGEYLSADTLTQRGYEDGARHPLVVSRYADMLARPGQLSHLSQALHLCDTTLAIRQGSTSPGWHELQRTADRLAAQIRHIKQRIHGTIDEHGNPLPSPKPKRTHPLRFKPSYGPISSDADAT